MNKLSFQLFYFLTVIFLCYAADYEEEIINNRQLYDINYLVRYSLSRFYNSRNFINEDSEHLMIQFKNIGDYVSFQSNKNQQTSKCSKDILFMLENFKKIWALKMFDSYGKLGSGILQGNFKWIGDYNECIGVESSNPNSTVGNFKGKYCSVSWHLSILNGSVSVPMVNGICVPDSCSAAEIQNVLKLPHWTGNITSLLNDEKSSLNASVTCTPTERHLTTPAKVVISLLSLCSTLAVLGSSITAVKYFKKIIMESKSSSLIVNISENVHVIGDDTLIENAESDGEHLLQDNISTSNANGYLGRFQTFLSCFCMFTNGKKLLSTSSDGQLSCLHGIRFLSMSWIILGHTYGFCFLVTRNLAEAANLVDNFPFQTILQAFYAVDSFFVLSGFLVAYLTMKEYEKTGSINWPYFYIHRYIRLTPLYMIVLGFAATISLYIGSGPFWPEGDFDPICKEKWWHNLLYINNFYDITDQCIGWTWYLANDMQYFIISPIFLVTLWRWPKIGYTLLSVFLCACCLSNFFITYHYDFRASLFDMFDSQNVTNINESMTKFFKYFNKLYEKPYTRINPYLIGILIGYLLFKKTTMRIPKYNWIFLCIGWIVATIVTLTVVYGLYHNHPQLIASSFYNALNRTCFALGLSWVIYVCLIRQGGFVNDILSFKLFVPLSRLTYTAYLIHPIIISVYYESLKASFEFSHPTLVITFLGFMAVTYGLSLPISLIFEYPFISLEKLIIKTFSKKEVRVRLPQE